MDDAMRVQVLQSIDNLCSIALYFQLMEALSPFEQLVHALILAKF